MWRKLGMRIMGLNLSAICCSTRRLTCVALQSATKRSIGGHKMNEGSRVIMFWVVRMETTYRDATWSGEATDKALLLLNLPSRKPPNDPPRSSSSSITLWICHRLK